MPAQTRSTAKKAPAKRSPARTDTPAPVGFNFDTYHGEDQIPPFPVVIGGQRYESLDPAEIDFREIQAVLDDPLEMFRLLFGDDAEEILENKISIRALARFSEAVFEHFKLADFIAAQS